MGSLFNPQDGDVAFFSSSVRPEPFLRFSTDHSESHVPGRHLNALLHAEAVTGRPADEHVIERHARAAFFSYGGAAPLPLNREQIDGRPVRFVPHNLREGFHALYALARYRKSAKARELAERSIAAIFELWDAQRGWDREQLEQRLGVHLVEEPREYITGIARAIGPLTKYFAATGHEPALRLALRLKDKAVAECFPADGSYDAKRLGTHSHSITCVLSSLAQLAELTADASLMARVRSFFDRGLLALTDHIGWGIEDAVPEKNPDRGEANATGDLLETALILGRSGYTEYYDRAELVLRAHLLPCQLRDISFIDPSVHPPGGGPSVAERHLGAFGFPAPYGHQPIGVENVSFNMDIVGGAVDSLAATFEHVVTSGAAGTKINLLLDHEDEAVRVRSPYTSPDGKLHLTAKVPRPIWLRLPGWLDPTTIQIGSGVEAPLLSNGYLVIPGPPVDRPIDIILPPANRQIVLKHRTRDIRVRLRGDAVVGMDNFGADLTYFDPFD